SGLVKFYKTAVASGLKPIVGADVFVGDTPADKDPSRLTLLCQSRLGLRRLSELLTRAYQEGGAGKAVVAKEWLTPETVRDLIALSGAQAGELGRALVSSHP